MINLLFGKLAHVRISAVEWLRYSLLWKAFNPLRQWRRSSQLLQWVNECAVFLLVVLFAIAPFVATNYIGVLEIGAAGLWLMATLTEDAPQPYRLSPIHAWVGLYWLVAVIATFASPVPDAALNGLIELTLYLLLFMVIERVVRQARWRNLLIGVYLLTAFWVTLYGLRQWFFGAEALATWVDPNSPLADTTRVYSYLGNPNLLAAYLIPAIPLSWAAMFVWRGWGPKLLAVTMFVTNTICLMLTYSRGGWIAVVATFAIGALLWLFWLLPHLPHFWRVWAFPILLVGGGLLLLGAVIAVAPLRARVMSIFVSRADSSNNFRINVWDAVKEMIRDRPILGIGPGHDAFNRIYPLYQRPKFSALSAYSIYLEHLVEFGIVGFTCFMGLLFSLGHQGWTALVHFRDQKSVQGFWVMACLAGMGGLLVHGTVDTVWYRPQVFTLWWLMAAIVTSFFQITKQPDAPLAAEVQPR